MENQTMQETANPNFENPPYKPAKKTGAFSRFLNKYFKHLDRGGSLKTEIGAGIGVFFISICLLFLNMQIIVSSLGVTGAVESFPDAANEAVGLTISQIYLASVIIAFVGSLLIGLVARLPFVQMSMMGLSSSMITFVGASSGLTYYNLLLVSFIAAIIYAVLVSVPVIKKLVFNAIPRPIRKILPAAAGLIVAYIALQLSGFISFAPLGGTGSSVGVLGGFSSEMSRPMEVTAFAAAMVAVVLYFVFKGLKIKLPVLWSFLSGTVLFIVIVLIQGGTDAGDGESFISVARLWLFIGSQNGSATPFADSYITYFGDAFGAVFSNFGNVFTEGTQFAEGVNGLTMVISGTLCYLFMGMYDAEAVLQDSQSKLNKHSNENGQVNFDDAKGAQLALMCNAGVNIIAPMLGVGAVSLKTSVAATEDSGKSGIVSVVASIGFFISMFVWIFPMLFATNTLEGLGMNDYNYFAYGSGGFPEITLAVSFSVANAVMLCVGISMCKCFKNINWGEYTEWLPAGVTVVASVAFTNLAYGVACGVLAYCMVKVVSFRKSGDEKLITLLRSNFVSGIKEIGIPTGVLAVLMLVMLVLA